MIGLAPVAAPSAASFVSIGLTAIKASAAKRDSITLMMPKRAWLLLGLSFAAVAAFFAPLEHWAHAPGFASHLLLLACPLMHHFRSHGSHAHRGTPSRGDAL